MPSVPMRISGEAAAIIDELSTQLDRPKQQIIDEAMRRYQTELRMRQAGEAMQRIRKNPRRWKAYRREMSSVLSLVARPKDDE